MNVIQLVMSLVTFLVTVIGPIIQNSLWQPGDDISDKSRLSAKERS